MEDNDRDTLNTITSRLKKARNRAQDPLAQPGREGPERGNVLGLAFRVAVEIVSAVGIGFVVGWLLDGWLGSKPWLMVVFVMVGFAAGILNVYRMASGFGYGAGYTEKGKSSRTDPNVNEEN